MNDSNKPSSAFWVVGVLALIWNVLGVLAYLGQAFMTEDMKSALPEDQIAILEATPAWATAAFAIAVWGGLLASILFLMKKKLSNTLFTLSFLGIIVQLIYNFFIANSWEVYGPGGLIMPILTVGFGAFLIWYSKKCIADGILK